MTEKKNIWDHCTRNAILLRIMMIICQREERQIIIFFFFFLKDMCEHAINRILIEMMEVRETFFFVGSSDNPKLFFNLFN